MMNKLKFFILALVVASVTLSSCLKDSTFMDVADTEPIIQFGLSPASSNPYPISYAPANVTYDTTIVGVDTTITPVVPENDTAIAIVLASPQVLADTVAVTVTIDTTQVAAAGAGFTALPDSLYTLPQTTIKILPGHRIGSLPVNLKFPSFPSSYNYALGISIVNAVDIGNPANLIVVSGNSGKFMWLLSQ
jgi:hypothetical protein